jgi:ATP-dependent 26S proteasome regulatory subunit
MTTSLSPAQQKAFDGLAASRRAGSVLALTAETGLGKSTVVRALHQRWGGALITAKDFMETFQTRHPLALEEGVYQLLVTALRTHDHVLVDDFDLAVAPLTGCHFYPRLGLLDAPLAALASYALETDKTLLFATSDELPDPIAQRCFAFRIEEFQPEDYAHLLRVFLGTHEASRLDVAKIHRFAPQLNAHHLKGAAAWSAWSETLETDAFIDHLQTNRLFSNVRLDEVAPVDLRDLKGVDDVIQSLEASIILPLENEELAAELDLKPKRGVLLVGPPGSGKTTIGRALATRLKGKFLLIDGTIISGTHYFYDHVHHVFEMAKKNAPSVIFIDDSDVIFESGEEHGLYRYLLTMLDGLESKSAGRVCVMMTAMHVGNLPPALVRSGRIELWLELRLPDAAARAEILQQLLASLPKAIGEVDIAKLAAASDGFTGADLKRAIEDGKALIAYDRVQAKGLEPVTEYFRRALETIVANKVKYAAAEADASAARPDRPVWFAPSPKAADDEQ